TTFIVPPVGSLGATLQFQLTVTDTEGLAQMKQVLINVSASMADLELQMIHTPDSVLVGESLTFILTVINNGPNAATGVALTETLPTEVTFVSANASQGACAAASSTVTCSLGQLNNGANVKVTLVVL